MAYRTWETSTSIRVRCPSSLSLDVSLSSCLQAPSRRDNHQEREELVLACIDGFRILCNTAHVHAHACESFHVSFSIAYTACHLNITLQQLPPTYSCAFLGAWPASLENFLSKIVPAISNIQEKTILSYVLMHSTTCFRYSTRACWNASDRKSVHLITHAHKQSWVETTAHYYVCLDTCIRMHIDSMHTITWACALLGSLSPHASTHAHTY